LVDLRKNEKNYIMKQLILGTANFGNNYGILKNKLNLNQISEILKLCFEKNIKIIDSAPAYGNAQKILGNFLHKYNNYKIDLISKTPQIFSEHQIYEKINKSIDITLEFMNLKKINTLLVHNISNFLKVNPRVFAQSLIKLKKEGKVKKIGISIYEVTEFEAVKNFFMPDVVQLPLSIIDQRFLKKKFLENLKKMKCEIHARSIFFQGLLLLNYEEIPKKLSKIKKSLSLVDKLCIEHSISRLKLILNFIHSIDEIDAFLVGIRSKDNLIEILNEMNTLNTKKYKICYEKFSLNNPKILDARNWS
tara:strand:+ start:3360 stop:4274 length:915 start_codon:yes stop_codon:yes gene_type:complete